MKEIENWEAVIKNEYGNEQIALPLPGCIIKGQIKENDIKVETKDVDMSNLIILDIDKQEYLLVGASREYLEKISSCIEYGKRERDGEER